MPLPTGRRIAVDERLRRGIYPGMAKRLHTIGYEGVALEDVLASVQKARIRLLIDVRAVAVSRRRGFSKTALAEALRDQGIAYLHLRDLGDPKAGREAARAGRHAEFLQIYGDHLAGDAAQAALREAALAAVEKTSCLLCYEAEPSGCHRAIVARAISEATGIVVDHLRPHGPAHRGPVEQRKRAHSSARQGCAPAEQDLPGNGVLRRRDRGRRVAASFPSSLPATR